MTGADLEAAAADSVQSLFRRKPHPFTRKGEPCANCGTLLEGRYCHECGQTSDDHHRSLPHLVWEAIEGMFHLDGRLARTLPLLFLRPGVLARDYMEGRIARHVPPFRTFLVALLLFIFAAEHAIHGMQVQAEAVAHRRAEALQTPQGRAEEADRLRTVAKAGRDAALQALADPDEDDLASKDLTRPKIEAQYARALARADRIEHDPDFARRALAASEDPLKSAAAELRGEAGEGTARPGPEGHQSPSLLTEAGFKAQASKALENPEYYFLVMFGWAHRLAVLLLPIVGLSLALVYVNRRQFFIYDHLLVATNLLSFAFLTNALGFVLPGAAASVWFTILAVWTPINLFQTLRGGYGSSIVGAVFKTLVVWFTSVTAFGLLLIALLFFSLTQI